MSTIDTPSLPPDPLPTAPAELPGNAAPVEPSAIEAPPPPKAARLASLDVFRGVTIAGMLLVNNAGKGKAYTALDHAEWHGWTPTDLVFPFFLFIVGVAIPFSSAKRSAAGPVTRGAMLGRIWLRALALFMLGALLGGFSYSGVSLTLGARPAGVPLFTLGADLPDGFLVLRILRAVAWTFCGLGIVALLIPYRSPRWQAAVPIVVAGLFLALYGALALANHYAWNHGLPYSTKLGGGIFRPDLFRIPGVLQRIAVCYGFAATIALFFGWRMLLVALVVLLATYSALMLGVPFPGHAKGTLDRDANLARWVDVTVFDRYANNDPKTPIWRHTYASYPDPEGLLSTIPAIGTVILGILAGLWLRTPRPAADRCAGLLAMGVPVTILGAFLGGVLMPINKQIWTSSFVVFCGGLAMLGLGALFYVVDVLGRRAWAWPFVVYGMNAIAAFVLAGLLVRIGLIVKLARGDAAEPQPILTVAKNFAADLVSHLPAALNTPQNTSLAYAILFVVVAFVPMLLLYALRIFIKV
jgi:predicted acyltransferase